MDPPNGRIAEFWWDPDWTTVIVDEGYAPLKRAGGWRFVHQNFPVFQHYPWFYSYPICSFRFLRFRDDKDTANDKTVLKKIWNSISDGVTREMVCIMIRFIEV